MKKIKEKEISAAHSDTPATQMLLSLNFHPTFLTSSGIHILAPTYIHIWTKIIQRLQFLCSNLLFNKYARTDQIWVHTA